MNDSCVVLDGSQLSPQKLHEIAHGAKVALCHTARNKMEENSKHSGSSILLEKHLWLTGESTEQSGPELIKRFILSHCAGVGDPLPRTMVRAAIAARINVLANAVTGSRPIAADKLIEMLNKNIIPVVPSQGSVGAAGDLAPMAHIARALCGYCTKFSLEEPLIPTAKEALTLINGVSLSAALAGMAVVRTKRIFRGAIAAAALTMEVVKAQAQCLNPKALTMRGHPEVAQVGEMLRAWLQGSYRVTEDRAPDAFSLRCGPSVMGAVLRTIRFAEEETLNELNGCSDNPLIFNGKWVEAGNFHGASIAMAMDHLKSALAQLSTLSERRIFRMTHGKLSQNLPSFLVKGNGLNSGFMIAQYTAAALASETKGLAHPASVDSIPTVQHKEDHVSMAPIAARMALESIRCLSDIIAIELLLGAQALDLRIQEDGLKTPNRIRQLHQRIREQIPFWEDDGVLYTSITPMGQMLREGELEDLML